MAIKIKEINFNNLNEKEQKETIVNTFKFILNTGREHSDLNNEKEYKHVLHSFVTNNPFTRISKFLVFDENKVLRDTEFRVVSKKNEKDFLKFINFHL